MSAGPSADVYVKLASEYSELQPVVSKIRAYEKATCRACRHRSNACRPGDRQGDARPRGDGKARSRREDRSARAGNPDPAPAEGCGRRKECDPRNPGRYGWLGSRLFAGDLFRMYERYGGRQGWRVEVLSASEGEAGGYKEIIATVSGRGVFSRLKFESGVHRVQRVPETEASGRIHTSAATVAVLPEAEEIDIEVRPEDIRVDTMRSSGAGGSTSTRPIRPCA